MTPIGFRSLSILGEADYYEGDEAEAAAAGNVVTTVTSEWLLLRGP